MSEAMLRAKARGIDAARAGAWMNKVVRNLCVEIYRDAGRVSALYRYTVAHTTPAAPAEEIACSRLVARSALRTFDSLPARQRQVVVLRADGHRVDCIAEQMSCGYKSVESLLSRARHTLRASIPD